MVKVLNKTLTQVKALDNHQCKCNSKIPITIPLESQTLELMKCLDVQTNQQIGQRTAP